MRGASIFDDVSEGISEALAAIERCRGRISDLTNADFRSLLEELAERDELTLPESEVLALCLSESAIRFIRNTPADTE